MKTVLSLLVVGMLTAVGSAAERFSLLGEEDQNVSPDSYLIALAPLQAPLQAPLKQQLQAPVQKLQQVQKQQQVQKLSLSGKTHTCALFPARRAALQQLRVERLELRQDLRSSGQIRGPLGLRLVNDAGDVSTDAQCTSCNVNRAVGERRVQENPGNQCNNQCTNGGGGGNRFALLPRNR